VLHRKEPGGLRKTTINIIPAVILRAHHAITMPERHGLRILKCRPIYLRYSKEISIAGIFFCIYTYV
jgi:hypothetical protein